MGKGPPAWAYERACALMEEFRGEWNAMDLTAAGLTSAYADMKGAFARYIAEHEEPPVDPVIQKTAAAFEALWNENEYGTVDRWAARLQELLTARGLQIVEAQQ